MKIRQFDSSGNFLLLILPKPHRINTAVIAIPNAIPNPKNKGVTLIGTDSIIGFSRTQTPSSRIVPSPHCSCSLEIISASCSSIAEKIISSKH